MIYSTSYFNKKLHTVLRQLSFYEIGTNGFSEIYNFTRITKLVTFQGYPKQDNLIHMLILFLILNFLRCVKHKGKFINYPALCQFLISENLLPVLINRK